MSQKLILAMIGVTQMRTGYFLNDLKVSIVRPTDFWIKKQRPV